MSQKTSAVAPGLSLILLCVWLAGCVTDSTASLRDARAEAPRPLSKGAYLPLADMSSNRTTPALTPDEQSKLKKELAATRNRQATSAKATNGK